MSKKVLLIEPSLAVRGIAESLLRQNGYEVFAADSAAAAGDILQGSKIDLLLVASDINDKKGRPFFETLGADSSTAILPLLVLHDATTGDIAYPAEATINKPFTPREFLDAVSGFSGQRQSEDAQETPFTDDDLEDAIIDSALGLDKIEVDEAEVLEEDTGVYRKNRKDNKVEAMIGYSYKISADDTSKSSKNKIDAINIPPEMKKPAEQEKSDKKEKDDSKKEEFEFLGNNEGKVKKPGSGDLSESSKIEIVTDQYGISVPDQPVETEAESQEDEDHDYDWFMKELRKEADGGENDESAPQSAPESKQKPAQPKTAEVDSEPAPEETGSAEAKSTHTEAVDKFISEFKKEMEKITGDPGANIEVTNIAPAENESPQLPEPSSPKQDLNWEEGVEKLSSADIGEISSQLISEIAEQIARKIVERLDEEIICHLIKETLENAVRKQQKQKKI